MSVTYRERSIAAVSSVVVASELSVLFQRVDRVLLAADTQVVEPNVKCCLTSLCPPTTYADNVALPAFARVRRAAVRRAAIDQYLLSAGPQQQNLQQRRVAAGWDKQTDVRQIHKP